MNEKRKKIVEAYIKASKPEEMFSDFIEKLDGFKGDIEGLHSKVDEFTGNAIETIKSQIPTPKDGDDGKTPTKEELLLLVKPIIPKPLKGSPDSPEEIREKLKQLKGNKRLSVFDLKDTEWLKGKDTIQWSAANGGQSSPSGGGFIELLATGVVNGSNQTFTFTVVPTYLVIDGAWYKKTDNNGTVQWSNSGLTITTNITPSNSIWGF